MKNDKDFQQGQIEAAVEVILHALGENVKREGLKETPARVAKAYIEWFRGYSKPDFNMSSFESAYTGMVIRKGIPFQSFCEHHLAMYKGHIDFAYIPNGRVVGLSKMPRLFQHISARLTIQEGLTHDLI